MTNANKRKMYVDILYLGQPLHGIQIDTKLTTVRGWVAIKK